jgi:hypothetical protein
MAKDPAVLLYTQDFLVGTLSMTDEQRGKYIYLLCLQHQKGKLTLTDLKTKLTDEDIEVAERFPLQADGYYYNQRMYDEALKRKNYTESRRNNRKKKDDVDISHIRKTYVNRMENENEDVNETVNVNTDVDINVIDNEIDNEYVVGSEEAELEQYYQEAYNQELEREYSKADRQDMLAEVITGSLDKEQKQMMNKFDNLFADEKQ